MNIEGWTELCLAEIFCSKNDKSKQVKSSEYQLIGLYPIVDQSSDFICGYCDDSKKVINNELPYTIFGDHTRHTKFVNFPFVVGADGTQIIKPIQSVDDRFFFYLVSDAANKIGNYGYDRHFKHLREFRCIFPIDKKEQKQIAEILSTIDRAIAQTEAIIAKQQRIKTGLMQDLLTKGIDENGNIRSEATHEFKDSAIGRIPVEWDIQGLASLLENIYQGWSPDCESDSASEDEWGVLKTTSVTWDGYDSQENKKLPNFLKPRPSLEIKKGDVLITRAGPNSRVGVICYVYETLSKKILSDKIYKLKFNENLEPRFFVYSLSGSASQQYLSTLKTGMAESQTNISQEIVKKVLTVIPSDQEQIAIANLLDENLQSYQEHLLIKNKLYLIKTGLMQDLLTGKVRVTNLLKEREPTSP